MAKSRDAFRTISEVSDWLDTPAHVLRFWESKFSQVKPVKRAGGRRYYRPADMKLLAGLKKLLHEDGLTIKGAQKVLREQGVKHVSALSTLRIDADDAEIIEDAPFIEAEADDSVVSFARDVTESSEATPDPIAEEPAPAEPEVQASEEVAETPDADAPKAPADTVTDQAQAAPQDIDAPVEDAAETAPSFDDEASAEDLAAEAEKVDAPAPEPDASAAIFSARSAADTPESPADSTPDAIPEQTQVPEQAQAAPVETDEAVVEDGAAQDSAEPTSEREPTTEEEPAGASALPGFLRSPMGGSPAADAASVPEDAFEEETADPIYLVPDGLPVMKDIFDASAEPGLLSALADVQSLSDEASDNIAEHIAILQARIERLSTNP